MTPFDYFIAGAMLGLGWGFSTVLREAARRWAVRVLRLLNRRYRIDC